MRAGPGAVKPAAEKLFGRAVSAVAPPAHYAADFLCRWTVKLTEHGAREPADRLAGRCVHIWISADPVGDKSGFDDGGACDVNHVAIRHGFVPGGARGLGKEFVDPAFDLCVVQIRCQVQRPDESCLRVPAGVVCVPDFGLHPP